MHHSDHDWNHKRKSSDSSLTIDNLVNSVSYWWKKMFTNFYKKYKYRFLWCIGCGTLIIILLIMLAVRIFSAIFSSGEVWSQINTLVQENAGISNLPQRRVMASEYVQYATNIVNNRLWVK